MTGGRTVVVGTAGHVDHGKSALVRALTGTDPDRLKEEQERGITINLGFAHRTEPDGLVLSFVDVPGHERFVRNMLAGASGVDAVLLVIAADESVMPQTREHLDICRLLGAQAGVIAITKSDAADADTLELVKIEAAELVAGTFLDGAPMVACSAVTREGLDELVEALRETAARSPSRRTEAPWRLPVDRSFTLKGFGTVVTGTAVSGRVHASDELEMLPEGRSVRVRGLHVHGAPAAVAIAGQRVALNLGGIDNQAIVRGDVLVAPGSHVATSVLDAEVALLDGTPELKDLARVRLHLGTAEVMARVRWAGQAPEPGGVGFAQLRLESPVVAAVGDRFILRRYSPVVTLGGGIVAHPSPSVRLRRSDAGAAERIGRLATSAKSGDLAGWLDAAVRSHESGVPETQLAAMTGRLLPTVVAALDTCEGLLASNETPRTWMDAGVVDAALSRVVARLRTFHAANPLLPGHPKDALRDVASLSEEAFALLLERGQQKGLMTVTRDQVCLAQHRVTLTPEEDAARMALLEAHAAAGLHPPDLEQALSDAGVDRARAVKLVRLLVGSGQLVKLKENMLLHADVLARLLADMASWYSPGQPFSVPDFKERSGTSRKHAIPLLEYLDARGHARREGEGRVWTGRHVAETRR